MLKKRADIFLSIEKYFTIGNSMKWKAFSINLGRLLPN